MRTELAAIKKRTFFIAVFERLGKKREWRGREEETTFLKDLTTEMPI